MKIKSNLKDLIKDAHFWQWKNINGEGKKPKLFFTNIQFFFILISTACIYFIPTGFNADFAGYIITALSLLIGISFNFILTLFNKFSNTKFAECRI